MTGPLRRVLLALLTLAVPALADEPVLSPTPGLAESQVTVEVDGPKQSRVFQATVLARSGDALTVLTAAHCISEADAGRHAFLIAGGEVLEGSVASVVRNPSYHPAPGRDLPGPDNAIARFRVRAGNPPAEAAFKAIRPASRLVESPYPSASGGGVAARVVDRKGRERSIRGGNFSNPLWLEWAQGYKPIPGDSGSGVFVLGRDDDGRPSPVLIGVVVGHGVAGGGASLVSLRQRWIVEALKADPAP